MPFEAEFTVTWFSWLSHCIIFQKKKKETNSQTRSLCYLLFGYFSKKKMNSQTRSLCYLLFGYFSFQPIKK